MDPFFFLVCFSEEGVFFTVPGVVKGKGGPSRRGLRRKSGAGEKMGRKIGSFLSPKRAAGRGGGFYALLD